MEYLKKLYQNFINLFKHQPRSIQEVFDIVIDANIYTYGEYMCIALSSAAIQGFITAQERDQNRNAIQEYLQTTLDYETLHAVLQKNGLPFDNEYKMAIYKDWANRPTLEK